MKLPIRPTSGFLACLGALMFVAIAMEGRLGGSSRVDADRAGEMVRIDGGEYVPLYPEKKGPESEMVGPFLLQRYPVTNAEYLAFVEANPEWRRSQVAPVFVDDGYLKSWESDLSFGPDSLANRPVVNVSWFAARAYAEWKGMRLPTTAEWELAAAAGRTRDEKSTDAAMRQRVLAWYAKPGTEVLPAIGSTECNYWGVCDLHGLVWEWVEDFNASLVTGESRNNGDLDLQRFCGSAVVGASDFEDYAAFVRFGLRSGLEARYTIGTMGFRLAADLPAANES